MKSSPSWNHEKREKSDCKFTQFYPVGMCVGGWFLENFANFVCQIVCMCVGVCVCGCVWVCAGNFVIVEHLSWLQKLGHNHRAMERKGESAITALISPFCSRSFGKITNYMPSFFHLKILKNFLRSRIKISCVMKLQHANSLASCGRVLGNNFGKQ